MAAVDKIRNLTLITDYGVNIYKPELYAIKLTLGAKYESKSKPFNKLTINELYSFAIKQYQSKFLKAIPGYVDDVLALNPVTIDAKHEVVYYTVLVKVKLPPNEVFYLTKNMPEQYNNVIKAELI